MIRHALAAAALTSLVAACTSDPNQAGFFSGVANIATGTYEQQEESLRVEAQAAEARSNQLQSRAARLENEAASLAPQQQQLSRQLAGLDRELARRNAMLADARATTEVEQARLDELLRKEGELTRRQLDVEPGDPAAASEIDALERENALLAQEIDAFMATLAGS